MNRTTTITLGERHGTFVDQALESGRYATVSEVVRAGLRLLEERDRRQQALLELLERAPRDDEPLSEEDHALLNQAGDGRLSTDELLARLDHLDCGSGGE